MSWTVPEGEVQLYAEVTDDSRYVTSGTFVDAPAWDEQPTSLVAHVGDEGLALKAKASVSDGEISYQWFRAGAEDFSDATPAPEVSSVGVEGVAALELDAGTEGVAYYRVKATNAVAKWDQTRSSLSDLVKVEILPVDKGALASAMASAEAALAGNVPETAKADLEKALADAKSVADDTAAKQADVDAAVSALASASEAAQSAEKLVAEKAELAAAIGASEAGVEGASASAAAALASAVEAAKAVASNPDATSEQVAEAKEALESALAAAKASVSQASTEASGKSKSSNATKAGEIVSAGSGAAKASYEIAQPASGNAQGTVWYAGPASKKVKKASVPATVTIGGKAYQVIGVKAGAFKGCKKLKAVTIGANVKQIGKAAFKGCKKLKKATVLAKQLDKKSCKNMKKGTKLKKVKLKGAAKASKKAYKKYFGKKVKVK